MRCQRCGVFTKMDEKIEMDASVQCKIYCQQKYFGLQMEKSTSFV